MGEVLVESPAPKTSSNPTPNTTTSFHNQSATHSYTTSVSQQNRLPIQLQMLLLRKQSPQSATDAPSPQTEPSNQLHKLLHTKRVYNLLQIFPLHKQSPLVSYTTFSAQTESTITYRCSLSKNSPLISYKISSTQTESTISYICSVSTNRVF